MLPSLSEVWGWLPRELLLPLHPMNHSSSCLSAPSAAWPASGALSPGMELVSRLLSALSGLRVAPRRSKSSAGRWGVLRPSSQVQSGLLFTLFRISTWPPGRMTWRRFCLLDSQLPGALAAWARFRYPSIETVPFKQNAVYYLILTILKPRLPKHVFSLNGNTSPVIQNPLNLAEGQRACLEMINVSWQNYFSLNSWGFFVAQYFEACSRIDCSRRTDSFLDLGFVLYSWRM